MHFCLIFILCLCLKTEVNSVTVEKSTPLIVTPLLNQGQFEEAQRQSLVVYEPFGSNPSYSGYFEVEAQSQSNLFFWFFPSENNVATDPVILCLQGGPGISSLTMLFLENGPISMGSDGNIGTRQHSWTKTNSILYIDSPVTVGFSVSNDQGPTTLRKVTEHLLEAVKQFYQMFPNLRENDFYIMGESYGGTYGPSLAHVIHTYNQNGQTIINLKGLCIGNGLTDSKHQTGYGEFLYHLGFINNNTKDIIDELEARKSNSIDVGDWADVETAYMSIYETFFVETGFQNPYNILDPIGTILIYDTFMNAYLNRDEVKSALHVGSNTFVAYHMVILTDMYHPVAHLVEDLLNNDYKILVYTGQLDFQIPYVSVVNYLKRLSFPGSDGYLNAKKNIWNSGGTIAGYVKQAGNLYEVLVRNAGHMAAMDQSEWVYDLVDRFVHNRNMWE